MSVPNADERDPYWDYDEEECFQCGGEGYVYGCSWDWQCDTYDEGEGTCLCFRRCDVCRPLVPDPELQGVLRVALAQRIEAGTDETPKEVRPEGREPGGEADASKNKAVDPYALGGGK